MQHKQFLVTGANGFIGRALANEFVMRGYATRCAVREASGVAELPGEVFEVGEIGSETDWHDALNGIDTVIHLVARVHVLKETATDPLTEFRKVNVEATERLADIAVDMGVRRLVYVSSVGVNGKYTASDPFSEISIPAPYNAYTVSKLEAEQVLFDLSERSGLEVVIIRPPLVYGPKNPGNFLRLLKLVRSGLPLPLANVKNCRSMIYVENLIDVLIACADCPNPLNGVYLVSDGKDISTPDLIRHLARLMGKPVRLWPFPPRLLKYAGKIIGKSDAIERLIGSLEIDSSRIRKELSWEPPYSMEYGLMETVQWYLKTA